MPQTELGFVGEETFNNAINRLKQKGAEFSTAYQTHLANYEKVKGNPQLLSKWQSIKNYADKTKAVIQTINNSVDKSVNWLEDVFGMKKENVAGLAGVGALPLVPIAYVLGAVTALTYVIGQIYQFNTLVNKGATAEQLTQQSGGAFGDLSNIVKWVVIGGAIWFAIKKFGGKDHG